MKERGPLLEVIVCSVADAVEAERGGAGRLEVIRNFELGGLTPPFELVKDVLAAVRIPVRVMLRESEGRTVTDATEMRRLCAAARDPARLRVDGLVLGFLREGEVDDDSKERILSCAQNLRATFHHAFEETGAPLRAITRLKTHRQIDRILTASGKGDWAQKVARLTSYEREARSEITILASGGLNLQVINLIGEQTHVREFHVGRAARVPSQTDGLVRAARVRELVDAAESISAGQP